ncbi:hypothetical protein KQI30_11635 [Clostridium bornimense]|uniref:hypothetical protein n=1 Tax=Clostridium bornimense TaxID=1216932 RepID=UPI001C0F9F51|nr:hypothetical protein [Clostridium bornimense]MBU5316913.1 hypothetical protein [Clostridium bornimense]
MEIFELIGGLREILTIITPLTLVVGIINAIKKTDKQEVILYTMMAIISAYLIVFAILFG